MSPVTLNLPKVILCCYNIQTGIVTLWIVHRSLPMLEDIKRMCHVMRNNVSVAPGTADSIANMIL